jgi:N-acetyl-anhydromuramyl-L-alanine amidase AmpD
MVNLKRLGMLFLTLMVLVSGACSRIEEETVAKAGPPKQKSFKTELTVPVIKDFMPKMNFVPRSNTKTHVVLHFISNAAVNPESPFVYKDIRRIFIDYDVSPHYMIDREGEIYFLLPESRAARHAGKGELLNYPGSKDHLNDHSIGIELMAIGTESEMQSMISPEHYRKIPKEHIGYTEAQYESLNLLLEDILVRHQEIKRDREHIIGHNEYAPERKMDPGSLFDWSMIFQEAK